jgi:hypothetical protein
MPATAATATSTTVLLLPLLLETIQDPPPFSLLLRHNPYILLLIRSAKYVLTNTIHSIVRDARSLDTTTWTLSQAVVKGARKRTTKDTGQLSVTKDWLKHP